MISVVIGSWVSYNEFNERTKNKLEKIDEKYIFFNS